MNQNAQKQIESYADDQPETQTNQPPHMEVVPPTFEEEFNRVQKEGTAVASAARRRERADRILPFVGLVAMIGFAAVVTSSHAIVAWIDQD